MPLHVSCLVLRKLFCHKRNQSHNSGFFNGVRKTPLVPGTSPMPFRRIDLALRIHKTSDKIGVFEINFVHFAFAKKTRLFFNFGDDVVFVIHKFLATRRPEPAI